ncbi:MAG: AAA family ATPase [Armatimonadetes bacterium]|nr:AAA family ATPase [Armatimonadota bacterium]
MKIAVSGKGGVGKTTISAVFAKILAEDGYKVIAIDADPDANLALTLGFPRDLKITPLVEMKELIEERTGAKPGSLGAYFKLNPKVDDIPEKYFLENQSIKLMLMGGVNKGGGGCACPENVFLKTLLEYLFLERDEVVIIDLEAGIEHLGRGVAHGVDALIIIVEPGLKSIETAGRIKKLAEDIGIKNILVIGNKIRNKEDQEFIQKHLDSFKILGYISFEESFLKLDQGNFHDIDLKLKEKFKEIIEKLKS